MAIPSPLAGKGDMDFLAAASGDWRRVQQVLEDGADPNQMNWYPAQNMGRGAFRGAIHLAAYNNRLDVIKILIRYGGDKRLEDSTGAVALKIAMDQGFTEIATFLNPPQKQTHGGDKKEKKKEKKVKKKNKGKAKGGDKDGSTLAADEDIESDEEAAQEGGMSNEGESKK